MLERNEIVPDALKEDIINARNAIAQLTEKGLDLSEVSIEQLNSILFSNNPNETLKGVAENISEEKKRELLKTEAEKIVNNGIPITRRLEEYEDGDYVEAEWDNNALQLAFNRLSDVFNSESCPYSAKEKTDLIIRLIAKVADDIAEERHEIKYEEIEGWMPRDIVGFSDILPHSFIDMAIKTFPSLELTEENIISSGRKYYNEQFN